METTISIFMDLEILSFRDCGSHSPSPWASNRSAVKWFYSVPPAMSRSINGPMKLAIFDPQSIQCWVSILWSLVLGPYLYIYIYIQYNMCVYIYIKHGCKNLLEIAFLTSFKWGNHETRWWIFQCLIISGYQVFSFGCIWSLLVTSVINIPRSRSMCAKMIAPCCTSNHGLWVQNRVVEPLVEVQIWGNPILDLYGFIRFE